jgi:predicted enzyme related to lactoylglutathione lyase
MSVQFAAGAVVYAMDVKRLTAFYAGVADLQETQSEPGSVVLEAPGFQLVLFAIPPHIAAQIQIATPPQRREDTPIKLVFVVRSLAAARSAAKELGGELDADDKVWDFQGLRVCDGRDPEGNVIQVRAYAL